MAFRAESNGKKLTHTNAHEQTNSHTISMYVPYNVYFQCLILKDGYLHSSVFTFILIFVDLFDSNFMK